MAVIKLIFIALAACAINIKQISCLKVDTMETLESKIQLRDLFWPYFSTGILKSHTGSEYLPDRNKTLILSAPKGYSLFVGIQLLDLRPNNQDSLILFANGTQGPVNYSNKNFYQKRIFDSNEISNTYYAPDGQLEVIFSTGPGFTNGYDGFALIYTVQANFSKCSTDTFWCRNGRCIAKGLKCDGHNHCGDRSEQMNCFFPPHPTPPSSNIGRVAGIVCGVVFLLIAVACAIYISIRRATRMKTQRRTVVNQYPPPPYHETGSAYPPPPPPYTPYNEGITNPVYH